MSKKCCNNNVAQIGMNNCLCDFPTLVILILIILKFNKNKSCNECDCDCDDDDNDNDKSQIIDNSILFIIALFFLCCNSSR